MDSSLSFQQEITALLKGSGLDLDTGILGVRFLAWPEQHSDGYFQIGYEWDVNHLILLETASGRVYAFGDGKKVLVNTTLQSFLSFLSYFKSYVASQPEIKPASYSAREMQEKLALFNSGKLEKKNTATMKYSPTLAARKMREYFRSVDQDALGKSRWWPAMIEQVYDGIL